MKKVKMFLIDNSSNTKIVPRLLLMIMMIGAVSVNQLI